MLLKVCSNFCTWGKVVRTPDLSLSAAYFGRICIFHLLKNVTLFFDSGLIEGEILSNPPKKRSHSAMLQNFRLLISMEFCTHMETTNDPEPLSLSILPVQRICRKAESNRLKSGKHLGKVERPFFSANENISANDTFSLQTSDILSKINEFIQNNAFF